MSAALTLMLVLAAAAPARRDTARQASPDRVLVAPMATALGEGGGLRDTCAAIRLVRLLAARQGLDEGVLAELERRLCDQHPPPAAAPPLVPLPMPPANPSRACLDLGLMSWMAAIEPLDSASTRELAAQRVASCALASGTTAAELYWPGGKLARSLGGEWYYPNGRLFRSLGGELYYANGRLARDFSGEWSYPSGQIVRDWAGIWYDTRGRRSSQEGVLAGACRASPSTCEALIRELTAYNEPWRMIALLWLVWSSRD